MEHAPLAAPDIANGLWRHAVAFAQVVGGKPTACGPDKFDFFRPDLLGFGVFPAKAAAR